MESRSFFHGASNGKGLRGDAAQSGHKNFPDFSGSSQQKEKKHTLFQGLGVGLVLIVIKGYIKNKESPRLAPDCCLLALWRGGDACNSPYSLGKTMPIRPYTTQNLAVTGFVLGMTFQ